MKETTTKTIELSEQDVRGAIYKLLISEGRIDPGNPMELDWRIEKEYDEGDWRGEYPPTSVFKGATATVETKS